MPDSKNTVVIGNPDELGQPATRRNFLKLLGVGGTIVLLPSVFAACGDDDPVSPTGRQPNSGDAVTIDFAKGDIAVLQFAFALEQLEADFYTKVVQNFGASNITAEEKVVLGDIKNHEVIHREALKATLMADGAFTLTPTYGNLNFRDRAAVLAAARDFEDLGVAAYNGAGQYITNGEYLLIAGKIVSVEARHASAIRGLLNPKAGDFAPEAFDDAFSPGKVAGIAQNFIVDKLGFANAPTTFAQGPNGNG
jgi:hypothetical protein